MRETFPVLYGNYAVPWAFVEPHEPQAISNHSQSLERLAQRGGLSWLELYAVISDRGYWSIRAMTEGQAQIAVMAQLNEFTRKQQSRIENQVAFKHALPMDERNPNDNQG